MAMHKVLVLDDAINETAFEMLAPQCELIGRTKAWASDEVILPLCGAADAFLVRGCNVTAQVMDATPNLRIIARHGAGVDSVDLGAATARGIVVSFTGDANAPSVAELTMGMLLNLVRAFPRMDASMKKGEWSRNAFLGTEVAGKTLGIVGLGNIGARVAALARAFGMKVLAYDPPLPLDVVRQRGAEPVSLEALFGGSDFVSFHTRTTPETRHTLNRKTLAWLKPGVRIINSARGAIIETEALIEGLSSGRIAAAALDTYEEEPLPAGHPLRALPNLVLSPHVGGQTDEARVRMASGAAQAILDELSGRRPPYVANPEAYERRKALGK